MTRVAVTIPVGPLLHHRQYLDAAIESIVAQTTEPEFVTIVDDMANLDDRHYGTLANEVDDIGMLHVHNYWRLGAAASFNVGVVSSFVHGADVVIMLGADDVLMPDCVEQLVAAYEAAERPDERYYWFGVQYSDGREDQYLPCHAAAVTPGLWRWTGGFSPAMGLWAPDAALISVILAHDSGVLAGVAVDRDAGGHPLYWHRIHEAQETAQSGIWAANGLGDQVRGVITETFKPADGWGRYG